jgi:hypothetical protein
MAERNIPLGFDDRQQFVDAANQIRKSAEADDAVIGVRGSASTGASATTGEAFGTGSDIDFFVVSDTLFQNALAMGAREHNGALRVGATPRYFPALHTAERELSEQLGRKATVRIFSRAGYDFIMAETDLIGG